MPRKSDPPNIFAPPIVGKCFVMQPFDGANFDKRYVDVFEPAIRAAGLEPYRVDKDPGADVLIDDIEKGIADSIACFAEITTDNPNVWYELGYALASAKPTCLVCSSERQNAFPFDVRHRSILKYQVGSLSDFRKVGDEITARLQALLKKQNEIQSLSALQSTTQSQGLTPHEISVLALIMAQFGANGVGSWDLKQDMTKAGYTEIATGIALQKLKRGGYINVASLYDERGEEYTGWTLTDKGTDWLIANEDKLALRQQPKATPRYDGAG